MSSPKKSESECTEAAPAITNNAIEDDPFISFQELIGDALNSSTVAATKMIQVMAEVFTQQQQILNLQIQNQEILKDNQQLLKKIEHSHQKLLSQESSHGHRQLRVEEEPEEVFIKTESESPSLPKRSRTNEEERRRKKRARNDPLCAQLSPLLEALIEYKDSDGRQISADFIQLPSKRDLPAYYKLVSQPMDFTRLRKNLKRGHYDTIDAFSNDIKLLVSNCQSFNREDSEIYQDSETILAIWERLKASATALL